MKWNPIINGLGATAYVWSIGFLINYIGRLHRDTPDNLVGSITALSLFVFSAAVMVFFFFYRPAVLLSEKKNGEAITFFLKTLATFGIITLLMIFTIL